MCCWNIGPSTCYWFRSDCSYFFVLTSAGDSPLTSSPLFFPSPRQRNRQRPVPVPMTGVHPSLLSMCTLNTLTWPDLKHWQKQWLRGCGKTEYIYVYLNADDWHSSIVWALTGMAVYKAGIIDRPDSIAHWKYKNITKLESDKIWSCPLTISSLSSVFGCLCTRAFLFMLKVKNQK